MRNYEITFESVNSEHYPKPITALIVEPDVLPENPGVMLFTHGWSGNRLAYREMMEFTAENFGLIGIATEFRQSGFDFNPVTGLGSYRPYDTSFFQTIDVMNALRTVLELRPQADRSRLFHYGGSQGGHIALLSAIFAPQTFAFVYAACPVTYLDQRFRINAGRTFSDFELAARNVHQHAQRIQCPVYIEHGTADPVVHWEKHTQALVSKLEALGKPVFCKIYPGGDHSLQPVISRAESFRQRVPDPIKTLQNSRTDDLAVGQVIRIPCGPKDLVIDWREPTQSMDLIKFVDGGD